MALMQEAYLISRREGASAAGPTPAGMATRIGIAMIFAALALMMPGIAIAALLLLSGVYLMAAALLAVTAIVDAKQKPGSWDRVVQDDVADLAHGDAAIWPIVANLACVVVLGA
jgi:hypothetical protein